MNMKSCGHHNGRQHRKINNGKNYAPLYISLKFGSLENMKITSSGPKYYLVISGKELITYLGLKTIGRSKKNKKERYAITNVSKKNHLNIIKEVKKIPYEGYVWKSPKHEPTDS